MSDIKINVDAIPLKKKSGLVKNENGELDLALGYKYGDNEKISKYSVAPLVFGTISLGGVFGNKKNELLGIPIDTDKPGLKMSETGLYVVGGEKSITWEEGCNLNDYTSTGVFFIEGNRVENDNMPILNSGIISARLTVFRTDDNNGNVVISQVLFLNNNGGGEGNTYTRSCQNDAWSDWGKLQTNIEVNAIGLGQTKTFDDLTDNGIYSGVNVYHTGDYSNGYPVTSYETFVLVVINAYATGGGVSQLKYSLKLDGETTVQTRVYTSYWSEWDNLAADIDIPYATTDEPGLVKLGTNRDSNFVFLPICNDSERGLGINLGSGFDFSYVNGVLQLKEAGVHSIGGVSLGTDSGITGKGGIAISPLALGSVVISGSHWNTSGDKVGLPFNTEHFEVTESKGFCLKDNVGVTKVTWDSSSNLNDFKTAGVYEIYGERINHSDNVPINNAASGHSFSARLIVISSTLQPDNTEISVTQFLMLSNRKGGDGNIYTRSYNENNSPFENGWTGWKKSLGSEEGYIFTDSRRLNQDWGLQTVEVGLNWMVDNGYYSGVYVNEEALVQKGSLDPYGNGWGEFNTDVNKIKFIETFNITTINDYAVASQVNNLFDQLGLSSYKKNRQVCQIKTATNFLNGKSTIKKRVYTGNENDYGNPDKWSSWEPVSLEIGSGLSYNEVYNTLNVNLGTGLVFGNEYKIVVDLLKDESINEPTRFVPLYHGYTASRNGSLGILIGDGLNISLDSNGFYQLQLDNNGEGGCPVVTLGSDVKSKSLEPNTYYVWEDNMSSLTVSLGSEVSGIVNEFNFQFKCGSDPTSLTLPSDILWVDGKSPEIEANSTYQISIMNKLGVCVKFY